MTNGKHKIEVKYPDIYEPFYKDVSLDQKQVDQIVLHHLQLEGYKETSKIFINENSELNPGI